MGRERSSDGARYIPPPKAKFDQRVEAAIEDRQNAGQEVEVQVEKRNELKQESKRRVQRVEQAKNAEFQQLLGELEARKQQANDSLIAAKRTADQGFIGREAEGKAYRDEQVTRAKANQVADRQQAEAMVAKILAGHGHRWGGVGGEHTRPERSPMGLVAGRGACAREA